MTEPEEKEAGFFDCTCSCFYGHYGSCNRVRCLGLYAFSMAAVFVLTAFYAGWDGLAAEKLMTSFAAATISVGLFFFAIVSGIGKERRGK